MDMIDISLIKADNKYLRLDTDVDKLVKSIETVGLISPLVINQDNELIAGGRRFTALKTLGVEQVPVYRVEKSKLEQELISIDENLIRLDLKNTEFEKALGRGKEIYENLYPNALKFDEEDLTLPQENEIRKDLPNDKRSFIDMTAEKTGLSKRVIKSAIDREQKSSDTIKKLRAGGELNASQTNEVIKLEKEDQEKVANYIKGKSAKEVKNFVRTIKEKGMDEAIDDEIHSPSMPKEYQSLATLIKRVNKNLNKVLLEEITTEHEDAQKLLEMISTLRISCDQFTILCSQDSSKKNDEDKISSSYNMPPNSSESSDEVQF